MSPETDFSMLASLWPSKPEISFEEYMQRCLYHPNHGYYGKPDRSRVGKDGDFITSPHLTPLFSRLLGRAMADYDRELGSPPCLDLVELGADRALLGHQLQEFFESVQPELWKRVHYTPVELGDTIPESIQGIVFCNEFFDALPVRRVLYRGGRLFEIFVRRNQAGGLLEVLHETSEPAVRRYLEQGFPPPREGWIYEVNLRMVEVLTELARKIKRGVVVTIDYGYLRRDYAAGDRATGTLMCYSGHRAHGDPYRAPGIDDLTVHVNFRVLEEAGRRLGWQSDPLITQREFLTQWGLEAELAREENFGVLHPERIRERLGIRDLLAPGGISDTMRVLIQRVGAKVRA